MKKDPHQTYSFISKATYQAVIHKLIKAAKDCTTCSLLFIVKLSTTSTGPPRLEPAGLALVANRQLVLAGKGELCLNSDTA